MSKFVPFSPGIHFAHIGLIFQKPILYIRFIKPLKIKLEGILIGRYANDLWVPFCLRVQVFCKDKKRSRKIAQAKPVQGKKQLREKRGCRSARIEGSHDDVLHTSPPSFQNRLSPSIRPSPIASCTQGLCVCQKRHPRECGSETKRESEFSVGTNLL